MKGTIDHVNQALASARVEEEGGRVIVYEVTAEDLVSMTSLLPRKKTFRDSRLTVGAFLPMDTATGRLRVHSTDAMTYTYSFDQARTNMKRGDLQFQVKPLVSASSRTPSPRARRSTRGSPISTRPSTRSRTTGRTPSATRC